MIITCIIGAVATVYLIGVVGIFATMPREDPLRLRLGVSVFWPIAVVAGMILCSHSSEASCPHCCGRLDFTHTCVFCGWHHDPDQRVDTPWKGRGGKPRG